MNAIKAAKKLIARDPATLEARTLADLVLTLESRAPFQLERLYAMELEAFDLALEILREWRLDRYYVNKAKLYDLSLQVQELGGSGAASGPAAP